MKIKSLTIHGFRGFNDEQKLLFNRRLTVIYAPNSYGKTSISEALEWLLYGATSRVEKADSKEEYKGSYRNCHLDPSMAPTVVARFADGDAEFEYRGEMNQDDGISRFVNGVGVEEWPIASQLSRAPRPFILQHALKYLLLVSPDERFRGFARLLGLEDLDEIQRNVVSLCTKPEAHIPADVAALRKSVNDLESRLAARPALAAVGKNLKKGSPGLTQTYEAIGAECHRRLPADVGEEHVLPRLLRMREDAVGQVFEGRLSLPRRSDAEQAQNTRDAEALLAEASDTALERYLSLIALATVDLVLKRASFMEAGASLLEVTPGSCPFCGRPITPDVGLRILSQRFELAAEASRHGKLAKQRDDLPRRDATGQGPSRGVPTAARGSPAAFAGSCAPATGAG